MERIRPFKKLRCSCGDFITSWDIGIIYRNGKYYHVCDNKRNWIGDCVVIGDK
jgi:hypothetical protein